MTLEEEQLSGMKIQMDLADERHREQLDVIIGMLLRHMGIDEPAKDEKVKIVKALQEILMDRIKNNIDLFTGNFDEINNHAGLKV